jgi:hypothetical protein
MNNNYVLPLNFLAVTLENHEENLSRDRLCPVWDSNRSPLEYENFTAWADLLCVSTDENDIWFIELSPDIL